MENFLLSLDREKQIKMLEDALKEDRLIFLQVFLKFYWTHPQIKVVYQQK